MLFADIRAKGTGVVRFSSERDAQRACCKYSEQVKKILQVLFLISRLIFSYVKPDTYGKPYY